MKREIAESVLKNVMYKWDDGKLSEELEDIQIISEIKYDDYQQYTHGMRYVESLALWLRQFDEADRDTAYEFVKNELIYISEEEMRQLVELSYTMCMENYLLQETLDLCNAKQINDKDERKEVYEHLRRRSLFLGLSDGSHIDYFRRQNTQLNNEQVFVHYDFSDDKAEEMLQELGIAVEKMDIVKKYQFLDIKTFNTYFLIDDFSASGMSFIRCDNNGNWHGKLYKFYKSLERIEYPTEDIHIRLVLYVSTEQAKKHIENEMKKFFKDLSVVFSVDVLQLVSPLDMDQKEEFENLLSKNYDAMIKKSAVNFMDKHFYVGSGKYPYRGFADCSLPLVIYHNTPNNSFPTIWFAWEDENALFPRVTRHKED